MSWLMFDLLFDLHNQNLVENHDLIWSMRNLSLFCSNYKMIGHDLSNCK